VNISVVVSTFNNPASLRKCLWGFCCQSLGEFEVVIADDGSGGDTRQLIADFARQAPFPLQHAWQEHQGFRKSRILNQAIRLCRGSYLIFTDGDCLPRRDFVFAHQHHARPGWFLSGGSHINIPEPIHGGFTREDIEQQLVFSRRWLQSRGMDAGKYRYRLTSSRRLAPLLDLITPRPGAFVGCNSSAWKEDVLAVNGFDESYTGYGSEDRDLGVRLTHAGIRSRRLKYSLVCIHLDHPKTYSTRETAENKQRLRQAKAHKAVRAERGLLSRVKAEPALTGC
jgi:glycosyltransferase involved in cell wall biosynthesis